MTGDLLAIRHLLPHPVAYVLGGGGPRGAVQLGMLQALAETDLLPDLVVGTSVGSINGAVLAMDPATAAHTLAEIWPRIDRQEVFPGGVVLSTIKATRSKRSYVFDPEPLSDLMAEYMPVQRIEDLAVPYVAVATDFDAGVPVEIDRGDLRTAMLASAAIPVAYPWVDYEGRRLVDGGLVANVPVRQAIERGAKSVIVLDCGTFGTEGKWAEGIIGVLVQTLAIASRQQIAHDLRFAADVPVLYLPVPDSIPTTVFDFGSTHSLSETARGDARAALERFAEHDGPVVPGLYGEPPDSVLTADISALRCP